MTFTKTVDSILSQFNKAAKELEALAQKKFDEAVLKEVDARVLQKDAEEANKEGNRALLAAGKIRAITE